MKLRISLAVVLIAAAAIAVAQEDAGHDTRDTRHRIADSYGVHSFQWVEELAFTFNVKAGDRRVKRSWVWWPKQGRVRYVGGTGDLQPITYEQGDLDGAPEMVIDVDKRFINDSFWLTAPFHLEWDDVDLVLEGERPLPMGEGTATKFVMSYPPQGGYTPGDTYELYVGPDYRLVQWGFKPSGSDSVVSVMTWEGEQRFGDITFATHHVSPAGNELWFSDISVKFADGHRKR